MGIAWISPQSPGAGRDVLDILLLSKQAMDALATNCRDILHPAPSHSPLRSDTRGPRFRVGTLVKSDACHWRDQHERKEKKEEKNKEPFSARAILWRRGLFSATPPGPDDGGAADRGEMIYVCDFENKFSGTLGDIHCRGFGQSQNVFCFWQVGA